MLNRESIRVNRTQNGITASMPAPVGGWNARDPLANMPITDAVTMVNWWPTPRYIQVRQGYIKYSTGYPSQVETIAGYRGNTQSKLFAACNNNIYDASAQGAVGGPMITNLNSNRWQFVNFTTTGGVRYLVMFNGADSPLYWNGTEWTAITDVSTPAITGLTFATSELINCTSHKSRLWLIRKNSMEVYFLPTGGVGGAASLFDLRPVFKRGGIITDVETWSIDTGTGLDDRIVFATNLGEIAIYKGTDPTSVNTWTLEGLYDIGGTIGGRFLSKFGGDVIAICQYGLIPLSSMLQSKVIDTQEALTDKIQFAISDAISGQGSLFGWQVLSYPRNDMLILNVPTSAVTWDQYIMNTLTGAWTRFTGWNGACWELYFDDPYFGGGNYVGKAWTNLDDAGGQIITDLKTSFNYFGQPGQLKQWTMVRPIISTDGAPSIAYGLNVDFDDSDVTGVPSFLASPFAVWDSSIWS
jgi:hypothetical protein